MKELRSALEEVGLEDVQTFIQSGNVVFRSEGPEIEIAECISQVIAQRFGLSVPTVLRTREQMARVISSNPFLSACDNEDELYVVFLRDAPSEGLIATLDFARSAPDAFSVVGAEVFLRLVIGAAKTKLTNAYFDSKLKTVSTARNWRTILKLYRIMHTVDGCA